jgi:hypothetical protein
MLLLWIGLHVGLRAGAVPISVMPAPAAKSRSVVDLAGAAMLSSTFYVMFAWAKMLGMCC